VILSSSLVFLALTYGGPDPAILILRENYSEISANALRARFGLFDPLHVQYLRFLNNLFHGDLGNSWYNGKPVIQEVMDTLPFTFQLAVGASLVAIFIGVLTGGLSAYYRGRWLDNIFRVVMLIGVSFPDFVIALFAILIFAYNLKLFPIYGSGTVKHLVLPSVSLGIFVGAVMGRQTRSAMLDVLHNEYIDTARAKGLSERKVLLRHALRNALIPIITIFGIYFGILMGGTFITEVIFALPGMGRLMVNSILSRDFPVVQGTAIVYLIIFVIVNLIIDILYTFIDPRVKLAD
jgi:ABC-type dipeptide/oligopeptide/nickel transport system permease component